MGYEKHIASQIVSESDQTILDGLRDISRQQKTPRAEGEFQNQRTVVGCIKDSGAGLFGWRRTDGGIPLCRIVVAGRDRRGIRDIGAPLGIQDPNTNAGNLRLGGAVRQGPQKNPFFPPGSRIRMLFPWPTSTAVKERRPC